MDGAILVVSARTGRCRDAGDILLARAGGSAADRGGAEQGGRGGRQELLTWWSLRCGSCEGVSVSGDEIPVVKIRR